MHLIHCGRYHKSTEKKFLYFFFQTPSRTVHRKVRYRERPVLLVGLASVFMSRSALHRQRGLNTSHWRLRETKGDSSAVKITPPPLIRTIHTNIFTLEEKKHSRPERSDMFGFHFPHSSLNFARLHFPLRNATHPPPPHLSGWENLINGFSNFIFVMF